VISAAGSQTERSPSDDLTRICSTSTGCCSTSKQYVGLTSSDPGSRSSGDEFQNLSPPGPRTGETGAEVYETREDEPVELPHRSPFLFRTNLSFPIPLKLLPLASITGKIAGPQTRRHSTTITQPMAGDEEDLDNSSDWVPSRQHFIVHTRVWSQDEDPIHRDQSTTSVSSSSHGVVVQTQIACSTQGIS
jgi:hypothetical protein